MSQTHYEVLGVRPDATQAEIRAAYKQLALAVHPDRINSAAAHPQPLQVSGTNAQRLSKFQVVQDAYSVLSNEFQRTMYDAELNCRRPMTAPEPASPAREPSPATRLKRPTSKPLVPEAELRRLASMDQFVAESNAQWDRKFYFSPQGTISRRPTSQQRPQRQGTAPALGHMLNHDHNRWMFADFQQGGGGGAMEEDPFPMPQQSPQERRDDGISALSRPSNALPLPSFVPKPSTPSTSTATNNGPLFMGGRPLSSAAGHSATSLASVAASISTTTRTPLMPFFPKGGKDAAPTDIKVREDEQAKSLPMELPPPSRSAARRPERSARKEAFIGTALFGVPRRTLGTKTSTQSQGVLQKQASERTLRVFFS